MDEEKYQNPAQGGQNFGVSINQEVLLAMKSMEARMKSDLDSGLASLRVEMNTGLGELHTGL
jgi:hypothetical protein